jgi:uncharacterized protein YutE (UPF0331/DUF86 family)
LANVDAVLTQRLRLLAECLDELQAFRGEAASFSVYRDDVKLRRAVERSLQVAAEISLDIGRRMIAIEGFRYAEDNQDVFRVLAAEQVVSQQLLGSLLNIARFRNLIVHDYAKIDDVKVYEILKHRLGDFEAFTEAIRTYLFGA